MSFDNWKRRSKSYADLFGRIGGPLKEMVESLMLVAYRAGEKIGKREMEAMYNAQCKCTDEWAEKYRAEVERKGDEALLRRVKELEDALTVVNARLAASNAQ